MSFDIGRLTQDQTKDLAKDCLDQLNDEDCVQMIREMCLADQDFCDELVASIEELTSQ